MYINIYKKENLSNKKDYLLSNKKEKIIAVIDGRIKLN